MARRPRQHVSLRKFIEYLTGQPSLTLGFVTLLFGLFLDRLADALGGDWTLWGISGNWVVMLALATAILFVYTLLRFRQRRPVLEMVEEQPQGKAGVILLLSPLDPRARSLTPEETKKHKEAFETAIQKIREKPLDALSDADFDVLLGTNLEPALRALEYHLREKTLRDCWPIGTPDEVKDDGTVVRGSAWVWVILQKWLAKRHPEYQVHIWPAYEVKPHEYVALWEKVDSIFRTAAYKEDYIICDITGGQKTMSLGASCFGNHANRII